MSPLGVRLESPVMSTRAARKAVGVPYQIKAWSHLLKHYCGLQSKQHNLAGWAELSSPSDFKAMRSF